MPITKNQSQTSIKNLYGELFSLNPSSLVTLYSIDVGDIGFKKGVISTNEINSEKNTVFRFHNNVKLINSSIIWQGKEFIVCPIEAEGFEITSRGTLPTPKLSITVSDDGIFQLTLLKDRINQLGDLVGAKVTRIRTFAKFLDVENFFGNVTPDGFSPDPNSELPRDVFYIERKSLENKNTIQYELSSIFELDGIKLPGRLVSSNSCPFQYRGESCFYEYNSRRNTEEHGEVGESTLPVEAPPIMTQFNEYIGDLISGVAFTDLGEYNKERRYNSGEYVYIQHNNLKYYFVANGVNISSPPPNGNYWVADNCSKNIAGCEARFAIGGSAKGNITLGNLPFGGWTACNRFK